MKRLTHPGDYCKDIAYCENKCSGSCQGKKIWEKLRAYEDTGLAPEEVEALKNGSSKELQGMYVRQYLLFMVRGNRMQVQGYQQRR